MLKIYSKQEFISTLRDNKFPQRQDSTTEQIYDLIPIFENVLYFTMLTQYLCKNFEIQDDSKAYQGLSENIQIHFDVPKKEIVSFATNVANMIGCYDAADYLKGIKL